jgi:predicted phosphodiesterase
MKTIILGDIHGKSIWKEILRANTDADRIVFIGDYFDSFVINGTEQIQNFQELLKYKSTTNQEIVLLIGNHDHHYFKEVGYTGTSGFQHRYALQISQLIEEHRQYLQIAYSFDNILCTHAGVGETFLNKILGEHQWNQENIAAQLNQLFVDNINAFEFNGWEPSGDNIGQTPIWIRPNSLMKDSKQIRKSWIQVVGHTRMKQIPSVASTNGRYYFIDTLDDSVQYLMVENGIINVMTC